ncbi:SUMO1 sentrin specific peptidase 8 [Homalodisca vitripennis]|nr:SUMO1 sentrin specific peptidase 8 [Homalodisca vitripennis]
MISETIYESPLYLNEKQEDIIVALTSEINILVSNNPGIDFEGLSLHISSLLLLMDHLNSEFKSKEEELQTLGAEIKILKSRLDLEKDILQEEMDTSFKVQDQSTSEILSLNKRIESLQAALRQRDLHFASVTAEKDSFKSKLDDMYNNIKNLNLDIENKKKLIENISVKFDLAKKEIIILKKMSTDKWLEDDIIDDYFQSMQNIANDLGQCLFLSPAVSHAIKSGNKVIISDVLNSPAYQPCKYVFVAVSNGTNVTCEGKDSHWSLLFIDKSGLTAYHLDSVSKLNAAPAEYTATNLNIPSENCFSVNCPQQNNGYECGINVIVHAKLIFNYFCLPQVKTSFIDWFYNSPSPDSEHAGSINSTLATKCIVNKAVNSY